jgi:hypothetical protein
MLGHGDLTISPFSQLRKIKARPALLNKTERILKKGRQER